MSFFGNDDASDAGSEHLGDDDIEEEAEELPELSSDQLKLLYMISKSSHA
jgi:hypothetical protein